MMSQIIAAIRSWFAPVCTRATRGVVCCGIAAGCVGLSHARVSGDEPVVASEAVGEDVLVVLPRSVLHLRVDVRHDGRTLDDARREYLDRLVETLDGDGDGTISKTESRRSPFFNDAKPVSDNPFLRRLAARRRSRPSGVSRETIENKVASVVGNPIVMRQNDSLAESDLKVFETMDVDGSGTLDPVEMRLAASRIAARDSDTDQCITFDEFVSDSPAGLMDPTMMMVDDEAPPTIRADRLTTLRTTLAARRLIDRVWQTNIRKSSSSAAGLTGDALGWSDDRVTMWDANGDGRITADEWTESLVRPTPPTPHFHVRIDLHRGAASMGVTPIKPDAWGVTAIREGQFRLRRDEPATELDVSFRDFDPVAVAVERARVTMNEIDVDLSGMIERDEIDGRFRFESYLFAAMDRDADDRVTEAEMVDYVDAYVRPAETTCRVTLYDLGRGVFGQIDHSHDGRISIRELRTVEDRLRSLGDRTGGTRPEDFGGHYRLELTRGQLMPFGEIERPEAEAPVAVLSDPVGPTWFTRMDRNSDGDLTWREFLGPRDVFDRYDADADGLIDRREAETIQQNRSAMNSNDDIR